MSDETNGRQSRPVECLVRTDEPDDFAGETDSEGFERELQNVINRYSRENGSNTPDWILARYMADCLAAWNRGVTERARWYGHMDSPGQSDVSSNTGAKAPPDETPD